MRRNFIGPRATVGRFLIGISISMIISVVFVAPTARYGVMNFNITNATLVLADPINLCSKQSADFTGKIVVASHSDCGPSTKLQFAFQNGALAVLAHVEGPRQGVTGNFYWKTTTGRSAPTDFIPYLSVNSTDGATIRSLLLNVSSSDSITGDVSSNGERNQWKDLLDTSNQYLAVVIVLIVANAAGLGFALSRLISLVMTKGCSRTTSHFTLSFICAGHTSTIIYFTINIIDIKTGPVAPEVVHNIFLVFPELFQMLSSLIVSLYWFELISSVSTMPINFVKKLFKPFIAFAIIISVLFVFVMILVGLHLSDIAVIVFYLIFVALSLLVAIVWIIVGAKMVHYIRIRKNDSKKKSANFERMSALIIICAICLIITRMLYLWLGLDPTVAGYPSKWLIVQTLIFIFQLATSFIQTGLFKFHKRDFKTSRGSSDDSRTNTKTSVTGGVSLKLSAAAATKGDSTAPNTDVENDDAFNQNDNASEKSSESEGQVKDVTLDPVPASTSKDVHEESSKNESKNESEDNNDKILEAKESSPKSGSEEEPNDSSKNSSSESSKHLIEPNYIDEVDVGNVLQSHPKRVSVIGTACNIAVRYGILDFKISNSSLVLAEPLNLCSQQSGNFTGKIVVATHNGCSPTTKIQYAMERGAIAILAQHDGRKGPAGNFYWRTTDGHWAPSDFLPYVVVNASDGDAIISIVANMTGDGITADLDPNDTNEWKILLDTSNRYLTSVIILIVANAAGLGFALSRLISLVMTKGCSRTTSHFTLSFICAGHTSTIIYFTINIIDIKTGPVAPEVVHNIFLVFPELFQMLSSLIVSLFWFELMTSTSTTPIRFVKKLSKPFIAFAIIICALYVLVIVLSGFNLSDIMFVIFYLVFVALSLFVAIIWIIIGAKMIHHIRSNAKMRSKKASNYNRLSALIIVCAACLVFTRMLYLWLALDPTADSNPSHWIVFTTLIFIFQLATAFIQTGLFKFHKRDFKTTSSEGSESKTRLKNSGGGSSVNISVAAATKGDSTAVDTITTERLEEYEQNDNSSEETKSNGEKIAMDVTNPISPRTDDTSSSEKVISNQLYGKEDNSDEQSSGRSGSGSEQQD